MATSRKLSVSNILCYLFNKHGKVPSKILKSIIVDFYDIKDIVVAKELLFNDLELLKINGIPKIRKRRDSGGKSALDNDDLFSLLTFCDENGHLDTLPMYVSNNPDSMPPGRLTEGDLELVWVKLDKLQTLITDVSGKCGHCLEKVSDVNENVLKIDGMSRKLVNNCERLPTRAEQGGRRYEGASNANASPGYFMGACGGEQGGRRYEGSSNANVRPGYVVGACGGKVEASAFTEGLESFIDRGVADIRHQGDKSTHWGSMGSTSALTDSEMEQDFRSFSTVVSKGTLKKLKRKERSPDVPLQPEKRANNNTNYQSNSTSNQIPSSQGLPAHRGMANSIVGCSANHSFKAADIIIRPRVEKAVFSITNVNAAVSVADIRNHCKKLGINVLFCFDISKPDRPNKAFKLAVPSSDRATIAKGASWPYRVFISDWKYGTRRGSGDTVDLHDLLPPSSSDPTDPMETTNGRC